MDKIKTMYVTKLRSSKGFTIIELMIALTVLSTILVLATVVLIQISHLYSKGVSAASLNNATRTVNTDISNAIQFSGSVPYSCVERLTDCGSNMKTYAGTPAPVSAFCVSTTRYTYVLNRKHGADTSKSTDQNTPHVLWRDTMRTTANCEPVNLFNAGGTPSDPSGQAVPNSGQELVPENMRLTRFKVVETPANSGAYSVDVWMAYGDDDLVSTQADGNSTCHNVKGSEFCATSKISNVVVRRVK